MLWAAQWNSAIYEELRVASDQWEAEALSSTAHKELKSANHHRVNLGAAPPQANLEMVVVPADALTADSEMPWTEGHIYVIPRFQTHRND